jgi:hypothetical protein
MIGGARRMSLGALAEELIRDVLVADGRAARLRSWRCDGIRTARTPGGAVPGVRSHHL